MKFSSAAVEILGWSDVSIEVYLPVGVRTAVSETDKTWQVDGPEAYTLMLLTRKVQGAR